MKDDVLTTTEAGKLCAVDRRTMLRWVDQGLLPHHRTGGGRRRILRSDLREFMAGRGMPIPRELASGPPRVVIVDDDPTFVASLRRFVLATVPEARVEVAEDGFAAGLLVSEVRPHLVFLDIVMPGMNGLEVLSRIRERPDLDATTVVVISGSMTPATARAIRLDGAADAMGKPPEPGRLRRLLVELLPGTEGGGR